MAALLLKVNGRDLSEFLRVQHDQGLDPQGDRYTEPVLAGSPALRAGLSWVSDAVGNKEGVFPLILDAGSTDDLLVLVRNINADLFKGARVEYRPDGASQSTFFDLERGRLDAEYQHFLIVNKRLRCVLRLWMGAYGHTGAMRQIANVNQQAAAYAFVATGIVGDEYALGNLRLSGLGVPFLGEAPLVMSAYAVWRGASFNPVLGPSQFRTGSYTATVVGASGSVGSQYVGYYVSPTAAQRSLLNVVRQPTGPLPSDIAGRFRVLAIARMGFTSASVLSLRLMKKPAGVGGGGDVAVGPTTFVSQSSRWQVIDLGEIAFPAVGSGMVSNDALAIYVSGASGAALTASPALRLNRLVMMPLDISAGITTEDEGFDYFYGSYNAVQWRAHPERSIQRLNASNEIGFDLTGKSRGGPPRLPAVGSPMPSGPLQVLVMAGGVENFLGNASLGAQLEVLEQFAFFK